MSSLDTATLDPDPVDDVDHEDGLEPREIADWNTGRAAPVVILMILATVAAVVAVLASPVPVVLGSGLIALVAASVAVRTALRAETPAA
ncbi:hypothetical protein [Prauserella rugosa]|uniref:Uncharacterized protein n=1 Tax=Prauserella rugosa TaxID=43354 RepID=A0A660CB51_9PSEU|nr:hypothetical protein [Prauserella rugosa]KMS92658.1 hypothetical protein ACZ91_03055 [Streptomyces regensis]TWH15941.1 hypothetical protein JD82_04929 [Prauserella rugosa]